MRRCHIASESWGCILTCRRHHFLSSIGLLRHAMCVSEHNNVGNLIEFALTPCNDGFVGSRGWTFGIRSLHLPRPLQLSSATTKPQRLWAEGISDRLLPADSVHPSRFGAPCARSRAEMRPSDDPAYISHMLVTMHCLSPPIPLSYSLTDLGQTRSRRYNFVLI